MVEVTVRSRDVELDAPIVVEGLPGVGLVGKIATDHLGPRQPRARRDPGPPRDRRWRRRRQARRGRHRRPEDDGMISGPAGALLSHAQRRGLDAVGLVVETDPRFPDPLGARTVIEQGIEPIAGVDVDTDPLIEQAESIDMYQ